MTHGALFNGIGGFQLAARWCDWENVFSVEIDKWCNRVTAKHFPQCQQYEDIYSFDGSMYRGTIDVVSGGFPCQPFSVAGERKGAKDDRYLWPEMLRVIREIEPSWVVGENVAGIIEMELDTVLSDLESAGYETQTFLIPACSVDAPHRRNRVWIVAHADGFGTRDGHRRIPVAKSSQQLGERDGDTQLVDPTTIPTPDAGRERSIRSPSIGELGREKRSAEHHVDVTDADDIRHRRHQRESAIEGATARDSWSQHWLSVATQFCRMDDGIPARLDRRRRLKALGNAIVPQVAYEIFSSIDSV